MSMIVLIIVVFDILILLMCFEIEHDVAMNTKLKKKKKKKTANIVNIFLTYLFFLFSSIENIL